MKNKNKQLGGTAVCSVHGCMLGSKRVEIKTATQSLSPGLMRTHTHKDSYKRKGSY